MRYRAAAALPCSDRERAVAGLRGQLRVMAVAAGATPDWATLEVDGPRKVDQHHGGPWFEWSGRVSVDGGDLPELPADDAELLPRDPDQTMPTAAPLAPARPPS